MYVKRADPPLPLRAARGEVGRGAGLRPDFIRPEKHPTPTLPFADGEREQNKPETREVALVGIGTLPGTLKLGAEAPPTKAAKIAG